MKEKVSLLLLGITILLCGCSLVKDSKEGTKEVENDFIMVAPGVYDSTDTAVVMNKNIDDKTITLYNLELGKRYTLEYDGMTEIKDKYGEEIAMGQIEEGSIVDISFYKTKKWLNSIKITQDVWKYTDVEKFIVDEENEMFTIVNEEFKLHNQLVILSEEQQIELMDLNPRDVLTVYGMDNTIISIQVEKGHGYLRLANDVHFIGGWIEVGKSIIQPISENMLLTVPEGSYDVIISHQGNGDTKEVTIERDREVTLDIGDIEIKEIKKGKVLFTTNPSTADIYIDAQEIDVSGMISLDYGIHQMIVKNEGYETISQYIKVGEPMANINIDMEKKAEKKEEEKKSSEITTVSGNEIEEKAPTISDDELVEDNSMVHIEGPEGAEVYFDNQYMGIAPVDIAKTAGTHVITLRQTDYEPRSYSIQLDSEKNDVSYSFSSLDKKK